jgi:spermidine/putrescine transport system substrate-binding protein
MSVVALIPRTQKSETMQNVKKKAISRRSILSLTGAALAVPLYARTSFATSNRELSIFFWSDELPQSVLDGFERETGITVNFTGYGSNDEMMARLQLTGGKGFDIVSPTASRRLAYEELGWFQPWNIAHLPMDRMSSQGISIAKAWDFDGDGPQWLPHVWGAWGIGWRTDLWRPAGQMPSYGDIWDEANSGRTMGHPLGLYRGTGLWLEAQGIVPRGSLDASYTSPAEFRPVWDQISDYCLPRKSRLRLLWSNADMQRQGFMVDGVVLGLTWDGPPTAMANEGLPVTYRSPREGAQGWVDGMSLLKSSQNVHAAHAFVEYVTRPEVAGGALTEHGYNTFILGATQFASARYSESFRNAYPEDALQKLWFTPTRPNWAVELENEYVNRFKAA